MTTALEVYKALADESRLRIVHMLSKGAFNVQEITSVLGLGQSTVSHHLKVLQGAGLTHLQREGTWAYYTLVNGESKGFPSDTARNFLETAKPEELFASDLEALSVLLNQRRDSSHKFFEAVADKWHELRDEAQGQESFFDDVAKLIPSEATVLELGCGSGAFLQHILPRSGKTIGVDYSQAMLSEARKNLGKALPSTVDLRLGYLEHLPIGDESIDIAVAYMVLHHLPAPAEAFIDAFRVLRPEGRLIVVDLVKHSNELMRERFADLWLGFEQRELRKWSLSAGFSHTHIDVRGKKKEVLLLTSSKE